MDGMLSQDEINALLSGMDLTDSGSVTEPATDPEKEILSDMEKDAIGEVANISMGSSATTLYSLVGKKVNITTPVVTIAQWKNVLEEYLKPCVFIQIKYTKGLDGSNILVLREQDVKVITDLMMGGDGTNVEGEITELHLSAISEAMNQMMGASATSLSSMLGTVIDISPPESSLIDLTEYHDGADVSPFLGGDFVKIAFRMQIENLVDSTIMQLYPIEFAKSIISTFMVQPEENVPEPAPMPEPAVTPAQPQAVMPDASQMGVPQMGMPNMGMPGMGMPQMGMPNMGMPGMGMPQMYMPPQAQMPQMAQGGVNIQPAQFQSFNSTTTFPGQENIGLIMDVPLEVTVELGRTTKSISEILDFAPGSIIELDRIAGEPIDVLVNGKYVAKGEVVVIEESFGIRVTEIIK